MVIRTAILTVSDRSSRGERHDDSGPALAQVIEAQGWLVLDQLVLPDERITIREQLAAWCDSGACDLILTTGGTGFSPRDVTPEATRDVIEKEAPGLAEAMRNASLKINPHAMLSRSVAGIRKQTLIVNLPGSPRGALGNLEIILPVLPHAVQLLQESSDAEAGHLLPPKTTT